MKYGNYEWKRRRDWDHEVTFSPRLELFPWDLDLSRALRNTALNGHTVDVVDRVSEWAVLDGCR